MDLKLKDQLFIVTGASSGFGKEITLALAGEKAKIVAVARRSELLGKMAGEYTGIEPFPFGRPGIPAVLLSHGRPLRRPDFYLSAAPVTGFRNCNDARGRLLPADALDPC